MKHLMTFIILLISIGVNAQTWNPNEGAKYPGATEVDSLDGKTIALMDENKILNYTISLDNLLPEAILDQTETNGIYIKNRNEDYFGATGENSVDLSNADYDGEFGATANYTIALGFDVQASADYSTAFGRQVIASNENSTAIGYLNDMEDTPNALFQIGNGSGSTRNNAYTLNLDATSYQDNIAFYNDDYSADYTNRSLVDKEYVDGLSDSTLNSTGMQLSGDQANSTIALLTNEGVELDVLSVGWLNNSSDLVYNDVDEAIELYNEDGELQSTIPIADFLSNLPHNINLTNGTLELRDSGNNVLSSVIFGVSNINGLQDALDAKANDDEVLHKTGNSNQLIAGDNSEVPISDFATAEQGDLADSALQPNDNISELTNDANYTTENDVSDAIDAVEIGVRNYFPLSLINFSSSSFSEIEKGFRVTDSYTNNAFDLDEIFEPDTEYTISGKIELISGTDSGALGGSLRMFKSGSYSTEIFTKNDSYVTFNTPSDISGDMYIYGSNSGAYDFSNIKIEKGNKATDWTPALEDQVSDWEESDVDAYSYIKNKPDLNYTLQDITENGATTNQSVTFTQPVTGVDATADNELATLGQLVLKEAVNGGIFISSRNEDYYGDIGNNAVDLSESNAAGDFGATGSYATSFGFRTEASNFTSTAFGNRTIASGDTSTAFGNNTEATGVSSTAFGVETVASENATVAFGNSTVASGSISAAFGNNTIANASNSFAIGEFNDMIWNSGVLFQIGNGSGEENRNNAYSINDDATSYQDNIAFYNDDYSSNYTDRSLVDKEYVDDNIQNKPIAIITSDATRIVQSDEYTNVITTAASGANLAIGNAEIDGKILRVVSHAEFTIGSDFMDNKGATITSGTTLSPAVYLLQYEEATDTWYQIN